MRRINIEDISDGDILGQAISAQNGAVLMYEGVELKPYHIKKLKDNHITHIFVKDPAPDKVVESFTIDEIARESVDEVKCIIEKRFRTENNEEIRQIAEVASSIISEVITNPDISNCVINVKRNSDSIYSHLLNVATLSTIIGIKIGMGQEQILDVARGAILHDIGLCSVDEKYIDVDMDHMPAAEKLNYRKHVITGYESIKNIDWLRDTVKDIVLLHHERNDGSGYPFHKKEGSLPIEVKLVAACDHFDELTNGIAYKKNKVSDVVEYFRTKGMHLFDHEIVNTLLTNIAWFPTDSKVVTNEGDIAVVFKQNKALPDRPVLRIIENKEGRKFDSELVVKDLTEDLTCFIVDILEE